MRSRKSHDSFSVALIACYITYIVAISTPRSRSLWSIVQAAATTRTSSESSNTPSQQISSQVLASRQTALRQPSVLLNRLRLSAPLECCLAAIGKTFAAISTAFATFFTDEAAAERGEASALLVIFSFGRLVVEYNGVERPKHRERRGRGWTRAARGEIGLVHKRLRRRGMQMHAIPYMSQQFVCIAAHSRTALVAPETSIAHMILLLRRGKTCRGRRVLPSTQAPSILLFSYDDLLWWACNFCVSIPSCF